MGSSPRIEAVPRIGDAMTPDQDLSAPQIEWPDEIWALERGEHDMRGEHVYSVFATVARWEGDREGQYHRYVDGDTLDSLKKYHAALIENGQLLTLADHNAAVQAAVAKAVAASVNAENEACAKLLNNEADDYEADASRFRGGTDPHHYRMDLATTARKYAAAIRSRGVAG